MSGAHRWQQNRAVYGLFALAIAAAIWVVVAGNGKQPEPDSRSSYLFRTPTGYPQLVSVQPLPEIEGPMCEWVPASSPASLLAAFRQERRAARAASASGAETRTSVALERPPVRVIRDPFPMYSAVAVDVKNNEIVLQDENLFQIMVYDRMTNTPPTASMTEPKRIIGGLETNTEFNCGLYVDPKTGDIYSVNNDTLDTMAVFSRNARGNVRPDRKLRTPHGSFGIAVDEGKQELFLTVQHSNAVVVYRKMAEGEEPPLRWLFGDDTQLEDPHGVAVDTKNNLLFVSNHGSARSRGQGASERDIRGLSGREARQRLGRYLRGSGRFELPSITVYARDARGNTAPLRIIEGPKTRLNWPAQMAVDEERGELYVANDIDHSILVFRVTDSGNVGPTRLLKGPRTHIRNPVSVFVDTVNNELVVANMGNHTATVYPRTAQGDTPPLRMIRSGPLGKTALQFGNPGSVAYDTKRNEIIVPN